jgi:hypothetical protein
MEHEDKTTAVARKTTAHTNFFMAIFCLFRSQMYNEVDEWHLLFSGKTYTSP